METLTVIAAIVVWLAVMIPAVLLPWLAGGALAAVETGAADAGETIRPCNHGARASQPAA